MAPPPLQALRTAIAETLYPVSAYELADVCVALGLAPPEGDDPMSSKRSYVNRRLLNKSLDELTELAQRVVAEYGDEHLASLLSLGQVRGADGEVKNIIFAADGPKPHIVLRNAMTNEIKIVREPSAALSTTGRCRTTALPGTTWRIGGSQVSRGRTRLTPGCR